MGLGIVYTFLWEPLALYLGVWSFSEEKIIGITLFNFPLEELLFSILITATISSAVLFFMHSLKYGGLKRIFRKNTP